MAHQHQQEVCTAKIAIIGAGALGSLFAGLLGLAAENGDEIWLVGGERSQATLQAIARRGLRLELDQSVAAAWPYLKNCAPGPDASYQVRNILTDPSPGSGDFDLALALVKSYQTGQAAGRIASLLKGDGLCLTLQNGLGNAEILAGRLGPARVSLGVTGLGATLLGPGHIRLAGLGPTIFASDLPAGSKQATLLQNLYARLQKLELPLAFAPDVAGLAWGKLIANCAINPPTALLDCPNGALLDDPAALRLLEAAAHEAAAVAQAAGVKLPYPAGEAARQASAVAARTRSNISSMLADVRRGSPTEIEAINGQVVSLGRQLNVPTPVNRTLLLLIQALTARRET